MKLGAVPLPINTQFNDAQIRYVLDTSNVSGIVTDGQFEDGATFTLSEVMTSQQ